MPKPRNIHRTSTLVMSILMVLIGIALLARTVIAGGGVVASGMLLGLLFIIAGAARLYLQFRV